MKQGKEREVLIVKGRLFGGREVWKRKRLRKIREQLL